MPLKFTTGHSTQIGKRERNEDFCGMVTPDGSELAIKGALFAVADGVSGNGGGREAAEYTVRGLLADYFATPETWEISLSLDKVLTAINRWIIAQSVSKKELAGMSCTLSLLVLRGNRYFIGHVGDTRVYRLSNNACEKLTQDHVWNRPDMQHVLKRAVGLDQHLVPDYLHGELRPDDIFLLCCDGVWEPLGDKRIHEILFLHTDPQRAADELVRAALLAGGGDNATALVVRVDSLPKEDWRDLLQAGRQLPLPARLKPGQRIDGFEVLQLLHESRATLLYKVRSSESGQIYALKTLQPAFADDKQSCEGLLAEEWLAKRLVSPHFPQIIPLAGDARYFLYYVMSYHEGTTLQYQIDQGTHFTVAGVLDISTRMLKGLGALHRLSITHRDIKPANLHIGKDTGLRILDMGVALAAGVPYPELQGNAGTPSYMAPELLDGEPASAQSDLYAAGVTLYHLLTRKYPYGEIEPFQNPRFGDAVSPTRYRPDIPMWLDNIILKAVAREPKHRFETAEEMLLALERGDTLPLDAPARTPLIARHPTAIWTTLLAVSVAFNLLLAYLLIAR